MKRRTFRLRPVDWFATVIPSPIATAGITDPAARRNERLSMLSPIERSMPVSPGSGVSSFNPGRGPLVEVRRANLIDPEVALRLYASTRVLFLTFDQCLGYVIEARTRLHDLLAWMRGTASQVRAWGTASDSIQRQNARARRISNGVVQRVSDFLSRPMMFESKGRDEGDSGDHRVLTECIIGMPLSVSELLFSTKQTSFSPCLLIAQLNLKTGFLCRREQPP